MERGQKRKKGRGAIVAAAAVAVAAVIVTTVLVVLKTVGIFGGGTVVGKIEELGAAYFMGLTEEEIVAELGEPDDRSETDGSKNLNINLSYDTGEQTDIMIHLFTGDAEEEPATANRIHFRSSRASVLGITPGESSAAAARQSLDKQGVYYMENDFDLNYYGVRDVMQEDEGWLVTYQEDDLSYLIRYEADGEQTVRAIEVSQRLKRDDPGGMFTCTQLTDRLGGEDPTALLGMTEQQAESRFGFCGGFLHLAKDFYTSEYNCKIRTDSSGGAGAEAYTTIELEGPGLAVQGVEVGATTLAEADAVLPAAGAREFTREAGEGVLQGKAYQDLDLEALENAPLPEDRRVYLTDQWYAELSFEDGLLTAATFSALDGPIDLTPPAPPQDTGTRLELGGVAFRLDIPEHWRGTIDFYSVKMDAGYQYTEFDLHSSAEAGYGGHLFTIALFDDPIYFEYEFTAQVLASTPQGELVVFYPTDVQFGMEDEAVYRQIMSESAAVLDSIRLE